VIRAAFTILTCVGCPLLAASSLQSKGTTFLAPSSYHFISHAVKSILTPCFSIQSSPSRNSVGAPLTTNASTVISCSYCVRNAKRHTPSTFDSAPVNPSTKSTGGRTFSRSPYTCHVSPATQYWAPVSNLIALLTPHTSTVAVGNVVIAGARTARICPILMGRASSVSCRTCGPAYKLPVW
jgi:hypothetical protein